MLQNSTLTEFEGRLYAADPWETLSNGIEEIQRLWPLAAKASDYPEAIGQQLRFDSMGFFELQGGPFKTKFAMRNGTETKCVANMRAIAKEGKRG